MIFPAKVTAITIKLSNCENSFGRIKEIYWSNQDGSRNPELWTKGQAILDEEKKKVDDMTVEELGEEIQSWV